MGKDQKIRLKLKQRLGIFSLAVIFSLILAVISLIFTDIFSDLFFAFFKEKKETKVIWVENRIKTATHKGKSNSQKDSNPPPANSPQN